MLKTVYKLFKKITKVVFYKIKHPDLKNFYAGKSLSHLIKKTVTTLFHDGPLPFFRKAKNLLASSGFQLDSFSEVKFPNGIKSFYIKKEMQSWFKSSKKSVSIVIPSYNDYEVLSDCIESIEQETPQGRYHVFIVDDYCDSNNLKKLQTFAGDDITIIAREVNGGFAKAVNNGMEEALKKYPDRDVILVNSDIVAHPGWLEALQFGAYKYHKKVGIVSPKLLYPDGRIQSAGSFRNPHSPEWFDHYYRFRDSDFGPANIPQYCTGLTGACLYIKNEVIKKIGNLDSDYPFAFEDMDYCLRAWKAGFRCLYFPDSTLTHVESATRSKNKTISAKEKGSVVRFWKIWGDWFDKRNVKNAKGQTRIIFVLQSLGISGGIKNIVDHANRLHDNDFDVEIWSLDENPPAWDLRVPTKSFRNYDQIVEALSREEAIKVATWWETAQPVWLASVEKGISAYMIQEIESWFYPDDTQKQSIVLSCYRHEFINQTESSYNLGELRALHLDAKLIPCGIDVDVYRPLDNVKRKTDTILSVGRTFFQKNFKFTLRSWKLLGDARPNMTLFGQEPEMSKLDPKITYIKKPDNEEVNKLYNQATCFIQTSYHEGFCLPPLEAMAAGCPVITTDSHGNRDYIKDGENCIMVDQDNDEQLKKAIQKVLSDTELRDKLSKNGKTTAANYSWENVTKQIIDFYSKIEEQKNYQHIKKVMKEYEKQT